MNIISKTHENIILAIIGNFLVLKNIDEKTGKYFTEIKLAYYAFNLVEKISDENKIYPLYLLNNIMERKDTIKSLCYEEEEVLMKMIVSLGDLICFNQRISSKCKKYCLKIYIKLLENENKKPMFIISKKMLKPFLKNKHIFKNNKEIQDYMDKVLSILDSIDVRNEFEYPMFSSSQISTAVSDFKDSLLYKAFNNIPSNKKRSYVNSQNFLSNLSTSENDYFNINEFKQNNKYLYSDNTQNPCFQNENLSDEKEKQSSEIFIPQKKIRELRKTKEVKKYQSFNDKNFKENNFIVTLKEKENK